MIVLQALRAKIFWYQCLFCVWCYFCMLSCCVVSKLCWGSQSVSTTPEFKGMHPEAAAAPILGTLLISTGFHIIHNIIQPRIQDMSIGIHSMRWTLRQIFRRGSDTGKIAG